MTSGTSQSRPDSEAMPRFDWPVCYEAEDWIDQQLTAFCRQSAFASRFVERLRTETGTLLIDWVDHLRLRPGSEAALRERGFVEDPSGDPVSDDAHTHIGIVAREE